MCDIQFFSFHARIPFISNSIFLLHPICHCMSVKETKMSIKALFLYFVYSYHDNRKHESVYCALNKWTPKIQRVYSGCDILSFNQQTVHEVQRQWNTSSKQALWYALSLLLICLYFGREPMFVTFSECMCPHSLFWCCFGMKFFFIIIVCLTKVHSDLWRIHK